MDSSQIIRALGPCEIYSASRHGIGFYRCVANTCRYSVPAVRLKGQAIRHVVETAVANAALAFPSLGVGIVGQDTSKPCFVQQPSINLRDHFEYLEKEVEESNAYDASLLGILEDQHDQLWPDVERRPPWKVVVVVRTPVAVDGVLSLDLVFAVHHAIADGRSTALFHAKLLGELNEPSGRPIQLSGSILNLAGNRKLAPPQEELVKFSTSWSFLLRTLWRQLVPAWLQGHQPESTWVGKTVTREPCHTRLPLVTVSADAVPHILTACRANRTTLTPLLHALVLASLARRVPMDQAQVFHSTTPIDLRPFIERSVQADGSGNSLGVFVTAQNHFIGAPTIMALREGPRGPEIWRIAADLRCCMKQRLDTMPRDDIMAMLGWVSDWQRFWLSKVGKPRQHTWEVSNIGSMTGGHGEQKDASGGWTIRRSIMSQGASVAGAAVNVSVAGVAGGEICVALGWQEGIVEIGIVDGLVEDLQAWLDGLGQGRPLV